MGFRFRKSVRLVPGVRLSVSKRGVGVSVGGRGKSLFIGPSGTAVNVGIPGTGLSYRQKIGGSSHKRGGGGRRSSSSAAGRAQARVEYRHLQHEQKERDKQAAKQTAQVAHEQHQQKLKDLKNVLDTREAGPFDWSGAIAPRGKFSRTDFRPMLFSPDETSLQKKVRDSYSIEGWLLLLGIGLPAAYLFLGGVWRSLGLGLVLFFGVGGLFWLRKRRRRLRSKLYEDLQAEHQAEIARQCQAHDREQATAEEQWAQLEAFRTALRSAVSQDNPEPLAELLYIELVNEEFPIPVVFDIEFNGCHEVNIELELPELEALPEKKTSLTKTGKLSWRKLAQRDRVAIYQSLCCGIALRLLYEAYRVLPMVMQVTLTGLFSSVDELGQEQEHPALYLAVDRSTYERMNLDRVDPVKTVTTLGKFSCNRRGELQSL